MQKMHINVFNTVYRLLCKCQKNNEIIGREKGLFRGHGFDPRKKMDV